MDLKSLQYFIAVVEATNISAAAKVLHMSQPPLSHQIRVLEEELGVQLLERGPRTVTMTNAGETLYHRAKSIVEFTNITKQEIQNVGQGLDGNLRIGMITSCGAMLLPNIIKTFHDKYPKVKFNIYERNTYELLESLENNLIELAFVRTPFDNVESFDYIKVSSEPLIAVGYKDYFDDIDTDTIPIEYLESKPLIIYRRWEYILKRFFEKNNVSPSIYCINDDARTSLMWANANFGVAIVPKSISQAIPANDIKHIKIDSPILKTEIHAIWNGQRYTSSALSNFIDCLQQFKIE